MGWACSAAWSAAGLPALVIHHLAPREPEPPLPEAALAVLAALPGRALPLGRRRRPGRRPRRGAAGPAARPASPWCRTACRYRRRIRPAAPPPGRGSAAGSAFRRRRSFWSSPAGSSLSKGADLLPEIATAAGAAAGATLAALGEGSLRTPLAASRGRAARRPAAAARPCP